MSETAQFRADFTRLKASSNEVRAPERLAAHYAVERRLADTLRASVPGERREMYGRVYQELFASLPDHPQHSSNTETRNARIAQQSKFLLTRLGPQSVYVEMGCGDAALTRLIAPHVQAAIGVDVTGALIPKEEQAGFRFLLTDGTQLDLPDDMADLIYSNQLMEHLHPDDAQAQLAEILRVLKPGGAYICTTPSRLTGPHDISRSFGYEPTGFHLREYDYASLNRIFRVAGFRSVHPVVFLKGAAVTIPLAIMTILERIGSGLPRGIRARVAGHRIIASLAGVTVVGVK